MLTVKLEDYSLSIQYSRNNRSSSVKRVKKKNPEVKMVGKGNKIWWSREDKEKNEIALIVTQ